MDSHLQNNANSTEYINIGTIYSAFVMLPNAQLQLVCSSHPQPTQWMQSKENTCVQGHILEKHYATYHTKQMSHY